MRRLPIFFILTAALLPVAAIGVAGQNQRSSNHDPDKALLVTSDIPNFWHVFDKAKLADAAELLQHEYFDMGSPGLKDFLRLRIGSAQMLAANVAARPKYYSAIRSSTLALDRSKGFEEAIRTSFRKLKELDSSAVFPDVYFLIGLMNSAGTTSSNGLLIGVEMNARDDKTPIDELDSWAKAVTGRIANLPHIVAHELIHFQQPPPAGSALLDRAFREGSADFVGELISGGQINRVQHEYGNAHEKELWEEFSKAMNGNDTSHWLYQGDKSKDRPADLGYYEGYKICEAYYRKATDKAQAVRDILHEKDVSAFLRRSGYSGSS